MSEKDRDFARLQRNRWRPTYVVDPEDHNVLMTECCGVIHRKPMPEQRQFPWKKTQEGGQ